MSHLDSRPIFLYVASAVKNYDKLRDLLSAESYPHRYIHKIIGLKSAVFMSEVLRLEKLFPKARRVGERESNGSGSAAYLAFTFEFSADNADEIIELLKATATLKDLKVIL